MTLVLAFSACPEFQPLPESELPVKDIYISAASYNSATNLIELTFSTPLDYYGVYPYYNKSSSFSMALYLRNGKSIKIKSTAPIQATEKTPPITGIRITLSEGEQKPSELVFKTKEPMYLFNTIGPPLNRQDYIEAKAYIRTDHIAIP